VEASGGAGRVAAVAMAAADGCGGGAVGPWRYVRRLATAMVWSRTAADNSTGERTGGGSAPGGTCAAALEAGGVSEVAVMVAAGWPE
jgi:hypothetical protein